ncbi:MAG: hypothetical protein HY200_02935 [Nitrospirae bacterium]|nr:hypothetical protein [Nitrospirota bacterium]
MLFSFRTFACALILGLSFTVFAFAQPPDTYSEEHEMMGHPMMHPGMDPSGEMEHPGMGQMWGHGYGGGKSNWMKPHNAAVHFLQMKEILGLNEKQVSDLKSLRDTYRTENMVNEAKLKGAEQELREILEEESINLEKADAKLKEIGALEGPVWSSFVKHLAKIKTIITKDQMKKMRGMQGSHPMRERE